MSSRRIRVPRLKLVPNKLEKLVLSDKKKEKEKIFKINKEINFLLIKNKKAHDSYNKLVSKHKDIYRKVYKKQYLDFLNFKFNENKDTRITAKISSMYKWRGYERTYRILVSSERQRKRVFRKLYGKGKQGFDLWKAEIALRRLKNEIKKQNINQ